MLDGEDFIAATQTVTFPIGEERQCAPFAILNDDIEELEEEFTVCIDSATPGVNTTSGNTTTTVVIEDDDSKHHPTGFRMAIFSTRLVGLKGMKVSFPPHCQVKIHWGGEGGAISEHVTRKSYQKLLKPPFLIRTLDPKQE